MTGALNAEPLDQHFAAARASTTSCLVYVALSLFDWRAREEGVGPEIGRSVADHTTW